MNKRIVGTSGLSGIMEWMLRAMFFGGILICATLPFTFRKILRLIFYFPVTQAFYFRALIYTLIFGVLMVIFVYFAARVFRTVTKGDPFVKENLQSLWAMGIISGLLALANGAYSLVGLSVLAMILCVFFLFFWGFLLVLREVFRSAIAYKEENEFTI